MRAATHSTSINCKRFSALALLPLLFAAGCAVGPDFKSPEIETPQAWRSATPTDAPSVANLPWWEIFKDAELQSLIQDALAGNTDIRIALARLDQAAAAAGITNAAYFPSIGYSATAFRNDPRAAQLSNAAGFTAGGAINWELDLWGRIRRLDESARAAYFATAENKNAVVLSLVAAVAESYFNLRALDAKLDIAQHTLETRKQAAKLARLKLEKDVGNEIDPLQFEAEMLSAQADLREFQLAIAAQENAINILLGRLPDRAIPRSRAAAAPAMPEIPAGVPSEVLLRRPDVRAAEFGIRAANAQIGAAVANYFPKITLTGVLAFASPQLKGLFDHNHKYTQGGGGLLGPLFDGGAIYHSVKGAEARTREAVAIYEKTALEAFREVNDTLGTLQTARLRTADLKQIVENRTKVLAKLSSAEERGILSKFPVLDADRYLYAAQLALVDARNSQLISTVRLYKALGGGWLDSEIKKPLVDNKGTITDGPGKDTKNQSRILKTKKENAAAEATPAPAPAPAPATATPAPAAPAPVPATPAPAAPAASPAPAPTAAAPVPSSSVFAVHGETNLPSA